MSVLTQSRLALLALALAMLFAVPTSAATLRFVGGNLDTEKMPAYDAKALSQANKATSEPLLLIIVWQAPPTTKTFARLAEMGGHWISFLPDQGALIELPANAVGTLEQSGLTTWIGQQPVALKEAPNLKAARKAAKANKQPLKVTVLSSDATPHSWARSGKGRRIVRASTLPTGWRLTTLRVEETQLDALIGLGSVFYVEPFIEPQLHGERAARTSAANFDPTLDAPPGPGYLDWLANYGLSGAAGAITQVQDDGLDQGNISGEPGTAHPDLLGRLAGADTSLASIGTGSVRGHGQINAGIIAGNASLGTQDADGYRLGLGIAPAASIYGTKIFNDFGSFELGGQSFAQLVAGAVRSGARFSNNSWGASVGGLYTATAAEFDALVRDADPETPGDQPMTYVFSAGNSGPFSGTIGSPATAKNVIAVGATENSDADGTDGCGATPERSDSLREIANFSSRGPAFDGRLGVTLVGVGVHVQGTASSGEAYTGDGICDPYWPVGQSDYSRSTGTSHSAPLVCGAAMLIEEHFRVNLAPGGEHPAQPSPALIKAVLVSGARDLAGSSNGSAGITEPHPDPVQGWGTLALDPIFSAGQAVMSFDQQEVITETGQTWEARALAVDLGQPLKFVVSWTDAVGNPIVGQALVNDLDLEVEAPDGSLYRGNVFADGYSVHGGEADRLNNLEAVFIENPQSDFYTIRIRAQRIAGDALPNSDAPLEQDFAFFGLNANPLSSRGVISLRQEQINCAGALTVQVSDLDLAGMPEAPVTLEASGGDRESLILHPLPGTEASFTGTIQNNSAELMTVDDGTLQAAEGEVITVRYRDEDDGGGAETDLTRMVTVDCTPPEIKAVEVVRVTSRAIQLRAQTDEPTTLALIIGTSCPPDTLLQANRTLLENHEVSAQGLLALTDYQMQIRVQDAAGNETLWPDEGGCYAFSTPEVEDAFTELFGEAGPDLSGTSLLFTPTTRTNGYALCRDRALDFHAPPGEAAQSIALGDDSGIELAFPDAHPFPFFGQEWSTVWLNSNGTLCFGTHDVYAATDFVSHFELPRIAGLGVDLDPNAGGAIFAETLEDRLAVTWDGVPRWGEQTPNRFQIELFYDGRIRLTYQTLTAGDALVGLSRGEGIPPEFSPSDLSNYPLCLGDTPQLAFSASSIACGETVTLELRDARMTGAEELCLTVQSSTGDEEQVCLIETPAESGIFTGEFETIDVASHGNLANDGYLSIEDAGWVRSEYQWIAATITPIIRAEIAVDCQAPQLLDFATTGLTHSATKLTWTADEPCTAVLQYGLVGGDSTLRAIETRLSAHTVTLASLAPRSRYALVLTLADVHGHQATYTAQHGQALGFDTLLATDAMSEFFEAEMNDLAGACLTFVPDGSTKYYDPQRSDAEGFSLAAGEGNVLALDDDEAVAITLPAGQPVSFFGESYTSFYLSSNGSLTFATPDIAPSPSYVEHFAQPRLSVFWTDLDPGSGGEIRWAAFEDRVSICFEQVPLYRSSQQLNAEAEIFVDGSIRLSYPTSADILAPEAGLVGLSAGSGLPADFQASALSEYAPAGASDRVLLLTTSTLLAQEHTDRSLSLSFTISPAAGGDPVRIGFSTQGNTALPELDYQRSGGQLVFEPFGSRTTLSLAIIDDYTYEAREDFSLRFFHPLGLQLPSPDAVSITIRDNDPTVPIVPYLLGLTPEADEELDRNGDGKIDAADIVHDLNLAPAE